MDIPIYTLQKPQMDQCLGSCNLNQNYDSIDHNDCIFNLIEPQTSDDGDSVSVLQYTGINPAFPRERYLQVLSCFGGRGGTLEYTPRHGYQSDKQQIK